MKKLFFVLTAVSALLIGCSKNEGDMSSPPASSSSSTNANTNAAAK